MRKCPYCSEEIQDEAVVCRSCGRELTNPVTRKKDPGCIIWVLGVGLILILIACLATLYFWGTFGSLTGKKHFVTYYVRGTANSASVTYENARGNTERIEKINLPWRISFYADYSDFLSISAQNSDDHGTIDCQITLDGKVWKTAHSDGGSPIATCSGRIGIDD